MRPQDSDRGIRLTALIPTYQCGHAVGEAIESVLGQTRPPDELIVVDDGSTDDTREVVTGYGDQVRYFYQPNGGCASARNLGIAEASGDWIAFLDSDDLWIPTHLEEITRLLRANASLMWAASALLHRKGREGPAVPVHPEALASRFLGPTGEIENYFEAASEGVNFPSPAMVVRKRVFDQVGGFDTSLVCGSDLDMWWRIGAAHPRIGFVSRAGAIWRQFRADSITTRMSRADRMGLVRLLERHLEETERVGQHRHFRVIASRMLTDLAFQAFYEDDLDAVRHVVERHSGLLLMPYRWPIVCTAVSPFAGRHVVRPLLRCRLWLLGRSGARATGPAAVS